MDIDKLKFLKSELKRLCAVCDAEGKHYNFMALLPEGGQYTVQYGADWIGKDSKSRREADFYLKKKFFDVFDFETRLCLAGTLEYDPNGAVFCLWENYVIVNEIDYKINFYKVLEALAA